MGKVLKVWQVWKYRNYFVNLLRNPEATMSERPWNPWQPRWHKAYCLLLLHSKQGLRADSWSWRFLGLASRGVAARSQGMRRHLLVFPSEGTIRRWSTSQLKALLGLSSSRHNEGLLDDRDLVVCLCRVDLWGETPTELMDEGVAVIAARMLVT